MTLDELRAAVVDSAAEAVSPWPAVLDAIRALDPQPGWWLLEAGCGPSVHLGLFAELVGERGCAVGVDGDPDALAVAAELWAEPLAEDRLAALLDPIVPNCLLTSPTSS